MAKKMSKSEIGEWKKYRIPGTNYFKMKVDAIHISTANSLEHELAKVKMAYNLMKEGHKILTEAEEIETGLRRDLVDLSEGEIWEFETDPKRAERHPKNINVIMVERK